MLACTLHNIYLYFLKCEQVGRKINWKSTYQSLKELESAKISIAGYVLPSGKHAFYSFVFTCSHAISNSTT